MKIPEGITNRDKTKISVNIATKTFDKLKFRAIKENKKFSDMVNEMCDLGLFDREEQESDELVMNQ